MSQSKQEIKCAKRMSAKPTVASGAVFGDADFRWKDFLVEHKYANKNTVWYNIKAWDKIRKQAIMRNRRPLLIFENDELRVVYCDDSVIDVKDKDLIFYVYPFKSPNYRLLRNYEFGCNVVAAANNDGFQILKYTPRNIFIIEYCDFMQLMERQNEEQGDAE